MYKKHSSFSSIAILIMPRLPEHERSVAIGMLQAGTRVSDVARHFNCHPSTIQRLRDRYQATGTVKDRRRSGQPRIRTRRQDGTLRRLHRRFPFRPATVSARRTVGLRG